ncbi:ABC transporter ATP-binding protein [Neorhizobium tomejilense]|uniref:ABC transporter ATP-binding protein n=1 Tax=Neorhizobium tomejilense TaxID=2093828 RepID=UPI003ECFE98E
MANLEIKHAEKYYGNFHALKNISVSIEDGEFVVLVGPSGCGKSTLLRMIAGLEEISGGDVVIGDRVVSELPAKERDIAMVFQNYALYPHMTVEQNMGFALKLRRMPKTEIETRIRRAAEILGLGALLGRYPRQLSGGQRQRVAMGRAIVRDPSVFLFDEPLSNLDAKLRVQMRAEIKQLHQRLKTTTVYVTHDQVEAMTMADRIVVLRDGVVEQIGTPLELYDNPANEFVAGFMGSPAMNFVRGELTENGFRTSDGIILPYGAGSRTAVTYGVRPEHLKVDPDGVPFTVSVIEPMGSETQVIGTIGTQNVTALFRERIPLSPGEIIRLRPMVTNVHLFDGGGRRAA